MSDMTGSPIEMRAILARIDRDLAEQRKLREQSNKFIAEQHKLMAEAEKLRAEERKLGRDPFLAPWLAIVGLIGGLISIASLISRWKGWG
jgi:hypothetical protein